MRRPLPLPKPGVLLLLERLPCPGLLGLVLALFSLGLLLPYLAAGTLEDLRRLGSLAPTPGPPWTLLESGEFLLEVLCRNLLVLLVLTRFLPWLEGALLPWGRGGFAARLYLLYLGPVTGAAATPMGLPHGGWYLLVILPLALGEFAAFTLGACAGRRGEGKALPLLLLSALYETYAVGRWL